MNILEFISIMLILLFSSLTIATFIVLVSINIGNERKRENIMKNYGLEIINEVEGSSYILRKTTYQVTNYDGDVKALEEFVDKLKKESMFNESWEIINANQGIIKETVESLD